MSSTVLNVTFDCSNAANVSRFWAAVTAGPEGNEFCIEPEPE